MIEVDLHLHTTFSDGRLTPTQLVRLCAQRGLRVIAITDHDTTNGLPEALETVRAFPHMSLIPGIELSTDVPGGEVHLLGYFVNYTDQSFQDTLSRFRDGRQDRARRMVEKLNDLGVKISWERVKEIAAGAAIGRPHIAQAMVEAGYVQYPKDAFERYIGRNGVAYVERLKLTPVEAVRLLRKNGALPVMAHPTYSSTKAGRDEVANLRETLQGLRDAGLVGMEVYYGDYTPEQVAMLSRLADELGLVPCGGSDYHASGNPGEPEPGTVGPPLSTVKALEALRHARPRGD